MGYDSITNRLYLKNKISGKKLRIVSDNMLTMNVEHYVVRFLREVTFANEKHPSFFWSLFSELDYRYIPEIMYNCIIIYPETWKVYKQDILNWNIFDDFRKEFDKYMGKWKIPKKINLLEGDRYLEFDLELMECWKDLYQEMKRIIERTGVCIIQKSNVDNECWVIDEHGEKYYAEFVFECMGNEKKNFKNIVEHPITKSNIHLNKQNLTILPEMRNYQPGMQGWIYLKIYICEEVADEFIYSEMCGFINNLKDKKILKQWFFIRYSDPDFHIRLRIKAIEAGKLFLEISEWIEKIKKAEKIGRIIIDTYEREIERYGGINSIEYAEQVFMADSCLVMKGLEQDWNKQELGIIGVYTIFYNILESNEEIETFLNQTIDYKKYREIFRREDKRYIKLITDYKEIIGQRKIESLYENRKQLLENYYMQLKKEDEQGKLTNSLKNIIYSVSHMFCNRLQGDLNFEEQIYGIIRNSLHVVNQREKNYGKNKKGK